jgi:hypothetical protein
LDVGRIDIHENGLTVLQTSAATNPLRWLNLTGIQFFTN